MMFNMNLNLEWLKRASFGITILMYCYITIKAAQENKDEESYDLMKRTVYIFWTTLFVGLVMAAITLKITWLKYTLLIASGISYFLLLMEALSEYSIEKEHNISKQTIKIPIKQVIAPIAPKKEEPNEAQNLIQIKI